MSDCEKFFTVVLATPIYFLLYPHHHSHCNMLRCYTAYSISTYCSCFFAGLPDSGPSILFPTQPFKKSS